MKSLCAFACLFSTTVLSVRSYLQFPILYRLLLSDSDSDSIPFNFSTYHSYFTSTV